MPEDYRTEADWRSDIVIRLSEPYLFPGSDAPFPAGAIGVTAATVDFRTKRVSFTIPNAPAMFLNISKRHYETAKAVASSFDLAEDDHIAEGDIFTYLENLMASVVFAYTALEAFANEEIPEDYVHFITKPKCTESYNKGQIESEISLKVKLGEILPSIHGVPLDKSTRVWSDFVALEKLRHEIIHMKSADREHTVDNENSIWSRLVKEPIPYVVPVAKAMIDHFYVSREPKRYWYENYAL